MNEIEIKDNDKTYKIVSRKITSKHTRIAKGAVGQRHGGALFLVTGSKRTDPVLRENRPCWKTMFWYLRGQQGSKCISLILFCLVFQGLLRGWGGSQGLWREGESAEWGWSSREPVPSPDPGLSSHLPRICRGDFWHTHSSVLSLIIYQACVLCLAPGQTLDTQRWRLHKVVSLGAGGIPENKTGAGDQEMFWFSQGEWSGILKLPASSGFKSSWHTHIKHWWQ